MKREHAATGLLAGLLVLLLAALAWAYVPKTAPVLATGTGASRTGPDGSTQEYTYTLTCAWEPSQGKPRGITWGLKGDVGDLLLYHAHVQRIKHVQHTSTLTMTIRGDVRATRWEVEIYNRYGGARDSGSF